MVHIFSILQWLTKPLIRYPITKAAILLFPTKTQLYLKFCSFIMHVLLTCIYLQKQQKIKTHYPIFIYFMPQQHLPLNYIFNVNYSSINNKQTREILFHINLQTKNNGWISSNFPKTYKRNIFDSPHSNSGKTYTNFQFCLFFHLKTFHY
jgi:hypothetical protein